MGLATGKWLVVLALVVLILIWATLQDEITCLVESSDSSLMVNGYYVAIGGIYINMAKRIDSLPDIFELLVIHSTWSKDTTLIAQDRHEWGIFTLSPRLKLFYNVPEHPQQYLFQPPPDNWRAVTPNQQYKDDAVHISHCIGSLADSPPLIPERAQTNLQILMNRPITTLLCCVILTIAYFLWSQRVEVSSVSFSYDSIVNRAEYWRFFTASFAHFDLLHLAFNLMSLYQLGSLEAIYSSPLFLTLNLTLVVVTMIIATALYHHLIHSWNRHELAYQQAVGFSCVLFAWMVAASVRMDEYCPLFFLPSLCFSTYHIGLPLTSLALPINIGPFVLLIVTKFILPRSSLTGHLSGIIIGFPLAWNWLNFLTPSLVLALLSIAFLLKHELFVWRLPGYDLQHSFAELQEFVASDSLNIFVMTRRLTAALMAATIFFLMTSLTFSSFTLLTIVLPRTALLIFSLFSISAMRCVWLSDLQSVHIDAAILIAIPCLMSFVQSLLDLFSLFGLSVAKDFVLSSLFLSFDSSAARSMYWCGIIGLLLLAIIELALALTLLQALQKIKFADSYLQHLQLDQQSFNRTMIFLGLRSASRSPPSFPSSQLSGSSELGATSATLTSASSRGSSHTPLPSNPSARAALERQVALPSIFSGNRSKSSAKPARSNNSSTARLSPTDEEDPSQTISL
jgi:membrane associated rhomboid family serine protease